MKKQDGIRNSNFLKVIIVVLLIANVLIIATKFSNAQKDNEENTTYYTGDILKPNHSANLLDYMYSNTNIVISPMNINTSINQLYNMNINNDQIQRYLNQTQEESNEFELDNKIVVEKKEQSKVEKLYLKLIPSLSKYKDYRVSDISDLNKKDKENLILLLTQIKYAYETISNISNNSERFIKNYVLTEEQTKINDYAIYDLLIECIDNYETYTYKTNINNYSEVVYNSDLLKKSKKKKKQKYPELANVSLVGYSFTDKKETTQSINNKVKEETNNNVKYVIDETDINKNDLYLINTFNFESVWQDNFNKEYITDTEFTTFDKKIEIVEMLHEEVDFYLENENATGFIKNFAEDKYSFVGILPNELDDFDLSNLNIEELIQNRVNEPATIGIPKFSFQYDIDLNKLYSKIGIEEVNASNIELNNLTEEVSLNYVISKTSITIDEKGTNNSKVRSSEHESIELNNDIYKINLNRPFAFLIIDNENNNVLLIGKVINPNKK